MGEPTAKTMNGRPVPPGATGFTTTRAAAGSPRGPAHPLLARIRRPRAPRLWFEILLIGVSYWLYSQVRNAVPERREVALRHADAILSLERLVHLDVEHAVNHAVGSVSWLIVGMNYYYATLHFVITISVLVWLYLRHPGRYGPARSVLFVTTCIALLGFWLYPLAPPRLLVDAGFIDTVAVHHTWGSLSDGGLSNVSNQYAAMPSMHIGWSLWCGITVALLARRLWVRIVAALYPVLTLVVIVSTGNHFWMDAVGGAVCLSVGYTAVYLLYARSVYRLPRYPEPA